MSKPEYDPEIQSVIDRFIRGDIPLRTKAQATPEKAPPLPAKSQKNWADSHEEAVTKVKNKKAHEGNYYERLANRGLNRKGDMDG